MPSASATAHAWSGPAPPNATSARPRGSTPCSTVTTRTASLHRRVDHRDDALGGHPGAERAPPRRRPRRGDRAGQRGAGRDPPGTRSASAPGATAGSPASTSPAPRPGFPPTRHLDAFEYLQRENSHFTIHAGEAFGLPSIWEAIQWCGADRLGHGVRIIDDITVDDDGYGRSSAGWRRTSATSGSRSRCARPPTCRPARRTPSPSTRSACCTELRFRVTVNTDNRLMSGTSMTAEMLALVEAFGYALEDLRGSRSTR